MSSMSSYIIVPYKSIVYEQLYFEVYQLQLVICLKWTAVSSMGAQQLILYLQTIKSVYPYVQ